MAVIDDIREAVSTAIPDSVVMVSQGSPGHFSIDVVSSLFQGRSMLDSQRLVYLAIAHLMKGEQAPVHAIDTLRVSPPP